MLIIYTDLQNIELMVVQNMQNYLWEFSQYGGFVLILAVEYYKKVPDIQQIVIVKTKIQAHLFYDFSYYYEYQF